MTEDKTQAPASAGPVDCACGRPVPERDGGDGELLWKAAKAAGYEPKFYVEGNGWYLQPLREYWNPLADDGEALRLAVALGITMYPSEGKHDGATTTWAHPDSDWIVVERTADSAADMRRAIVLAAVAMRETPNDGAMRRAREEQR